MRRIVYASLHLGEGRILDPFMGGGSTLAAADNVVYESVGVEIDKTYYDLTIAGVPSLAALYPSEGETQATLEATRCVIQNYSNFAESTYSTAFRAYKEPTSK